MVNQLKNILVKMGGPVYEILIKLAERPASLRLIDGDNWEKIESELEAKPTESDKIEHKIGEVVDLRLIDDCENTEEWIKEVVRSIKDDDDAGVDIDEDIVQKYVDNKMREGEMIWSESVGCMMSI